MSKLSKFKHRLTSDEFEELENYISIFEEYDYSEHYQVNQHITAHHLWDNFPTIRSLNDHRINTKIPGILPKYFAIVCQALEITDAGGAPLDRAEKY